MASPMTHTEMRKLAEQLRRLLSAVALGELAASAGTTARIEGAIVAIKVVLGEHSPDALRDRLYTDNDHLVDLRGQLSNPEGREMIDQLARLFPKST